MTAVDDARNPIPPDLRWLDGLDNELIERVVGVERKVAELEAQLRQEREAAKVNGQMYTERLDQTIALGAQVAQLQTTVDQLRKFVEHHEDCPFYSSGNYMGVCDCGLERVLATCPSPALHTPPKEPK